MKVGFIGLGTMGGSMAFNTIQGGHELVVHDIRRESATRHLEAGATWADSPREVAEASDIVFSSLATTAFSRVCPPERSTST